MDTGICYIIDENGYIMFISQPEGTDRTVSEENDHRSMNPVMFLGGYWEIHWRIRRTIDARFSCEKNLFSVSE